MSNFSVLGIPIYKGTIDSDSFDKQKIIKDIKHNYKIDPYRNNWDGHYKNNSTLHHSNVDDENIKFKTIDYSSLKQIYHNVIKNFLSNLDFKKDITFNYNYSIVNYTCAKEMQYMRTHDHINDCDFILLHYLQFDKETHKPTIYKNTHIFGNYIDDMKPKFKKMLNNTIENSWFDKEFFIDVKENDFVILPSCIPHYVPSSIKTDKHRIVIATNIKVN